MSGGNRFDLRFDLAHLLIAPLRLLLQSAQHDLVEPHVDMHFLRRWRKPAQRQFAGEHLVEHDAQRVDIGSMIDVARMFGLLGRHVVRRAHHLAGVGERVVGRLRFGGGVGKGDSPHLPERPFGCFAQMGTVPFSDAFTNELRQSEIGDLHLAVFIEQNILGFDIAMHDALVVGVLQGFADLRDDGQRFLRGKLAVIQQTAEIDAIDVFHDEIIQTALTPGRSPRRGEGRCRLALAPGLFFRNGE